MEVLLAWVGVEGVAIAGFPGRFWTLASDTCSFGSGEVSPAAVLGEIGFKRERLEAIASPTPPKITQGNDKSAVIQA